MSVYVNGVAVTPKTPKKLSKDKTFDYGREVAKKIREKAKPSS